MEVVISNSNRPDKRLKAKFENKTVHFGSRGGSTFIDHKDQEIKNAWEARHKVNENWGDYRTAGSLAKNILWNKTSMQGSVNDLNRRQKQFNFVLKTR
jgi:hypothetical protein